MATHSTDSLAHLDAINVWHPFTQMKTAGPSIPIISAQGVYLYGENGESYIDGISSWWVNLHGHAHPTIIDKINAQSKLLEHVLFAGFTHRPAVELSVRLLSLLPESMSKVFYSDNGSTSVEVALKMALQFWHQQNTPKETVICFRNSYHGDTFGAMSASGKNAFNKPFWSHLFEVESIDPPILGHEEKSIQQLQDILKTRNVACFIFEPLILGSGGMIIYQAKALDALIKICKDHNVLNIADEAMTGFGRTGPLFACEQLQEAPDMICLSKGLTGGFLPLGATVCTERIFQAFYKDELSQAFLHGHSYTANPLCCTSALSSLDLLLEQRCFEQRKKIAECHQAFCSKWHTHDKLKRCEALGTILALEYNCGETTYFQPLRDKLYHFFLSKGILLRPLGNVLYVLPPYCIEPQELDYIYKQIEITLTTDII